MSHGRFQLPLFETQTGWQLPTEFPNLSDYNEISIDTETFDPGLERGSGPATFTDGQVVGVAVGVPEQQWYFPVGHATGLNMDPDAVFAWVRDLACARADRTWVGASILYDLEYLTVQAGCRFAGKFYDVQYAAAILDEQRDSYALGALAKDFLGDNKDELGLYEWIASAHKIKKPTRRACAPFIHTAPPSVVGPYAESDTRLPLALKGVLGPQLAAQGLDRVERLEMRLIPLLLAMRIRGVRVDVDRAEEVKLMLAQRKRDVLSAIKHRTGVQVDEWAATSVAKALEADGVYDYPRTPKTREPSFRKDWLERHDSQIAQLIAEARKYDKLITTFVQGYILDKNVNGRLHTSFHPLASDEGGTVSGRFSSSDPNLQNIPSRDEFAGPLVRGLFIPDDESHAWRKHDQSQVEYRLLAHDAVGPGSSAIRARYKENRHTDYHEAAEQLVHRQTGIMLGRKPTKNFNFGMAYGMQLGKLCRMLGMTEEQAEPLWRAYHKGLPFVQATFEKFQREARVKGEVRTLFGRRRQWKMFAPRFAPEGEERTYLEYDAAVKRWGPTNIRRMDTHIGLNHRLQGTSADIMKEGMAQLWESGLCADVGVPLLTVHDELDFSAEPNHPRFKEVQEILENCCAGELLVPLVCEGETGKSWGDCA